MAFIQIVEFTSSRIEEMAELGREYDKATAGKTGRGRATLTVDRENPNRYMVIAEFDFPDAAGPSMAMMSLRVGATVIFECDCTLPLRVFRPAPAANYPVPDRCAGCA